MYVCIEGFWFYKFFTNCYNLQTMTESRIQQDICIFYRNNFCLRHHNPRSMLISTNNEGGMKTRNNAVAKGMYVGVSDIIILHNTASPLRILFIEVKRKNKRQRLSQINFQNHCIQMGLDYFIVTSIDEFKKIISNYGK